jgi:hypothetical protein
MFQNKHSIDFFPNGIPDVIKPDSSSSSRIWLAVPPLGIFAADKIMFRFIPDLFFISTLIILMC